MPLTIFIAVVGNCHLSSFVEAAVSVGAAFLLALSHPRFSSSVILKPRRPTLKAASSPRLIIS